MNYALCVLALLLQAAATGDWTPPANPDPSKILDEAEEDARAGHYAEALAKHLWFHENALKFNEGLYGVRLSFALSSWVELGDKYPPALQKLKSIRDETGKKIRESDKVRNVERTFHDYAAINRTLEEGSKTADMFVWLDANKPKAAERAFRAAEDALIQAKKYRLCGKYVDPDRSFAEISKLYRINKGMAKSQKFGEEFSNFTEKSFSNGTAILVALLVLNDRKADAQKIAEKALKERDDPSFRAELEKAKKGEVPHPWP